MAHTPGPWHAALEPGDEVVFDAHGNMVCDCSIAANGISPEEFGPNARLIAEAPNMLKALRDLVDINERHNEAMAAVIGKPTGWTDEYLDPARAAIAKATGDVDEP